MRRTARQRYRVVLNEHLRAYLPGLFGSTRAVYNMFLWEREKQWEAKQAEPSLRVESMNTTISKLTAFKSLPIEREWLKQYPAWTIQTAANQAKKAYSQWYDSIAGRNQSKLRKPRYKKKGKSKLSASFVKPKNGFKITKLNKNHSQIWLSKKIGWVKFKDSRDQLPLNPAGVTLVQEPSGKTYISFVCEQEVAEPQSDESTPVSELSVTAADLGLTDLLAVVSSDGSRHKVANPRHTRKAAKKLARAQKRLARMWGPVNPAWQGEKRKNKELSSSRNYEKQKNRVAVLHEAVRHTRQDYHNKVAQELASENQVVVLESLNVKGMLGNRRLAKSLSDAAFGHLVSSIKNACEKQGARLLQAGQWEPTSRTCSQCGVKREEPLSLSTRTWQCAHCAAWLDRDWNAALNILLAAGLADSLNACGGDVRRNLACADPVEARSYPVTA